MDPLFKMDDPQKQLLRCAKNGYQSGVDVAVRSGALVDQLEELEGTSRGGRGALHHAAAAGHLEVVTLLIGFQADVRLQSEMAGDYGAEPLHLAAINGHPDVVRALLEARGPVDSLTSQGATALHLAAETGHTEMMEDLLAAGANPNARDDKGQQPVHRAAQWGQQEALATLKTNGCHFNTREEGGATTLHLAAAHGDLNVVKWLVKNGANCHLKDRRGLLPEDLAKKRGHNSVHRYLKEHCKNRKGFIQLVQSPSRASTRFSKRGRRPLGDDPLGKESPSGDCPTLEEPLGTPLESRRGNLSPDTTDGGQSPPIRTRQPPSVALPDDGGGGTSSTTPRPSTQIAGKSTTLPATLHLPPHMNESQGVLKSALVGVLGRLHAELYLRDGERLAARPPLKSQVVEVRERKDQLEQQQEEEAAQGLRHQLQQVVSSRQEQGRLQVQVQRQEVDAPQQQQLHQGHLSCDGRFCDLAATASHRSLASLEEEVHTLAHSLQAEPHSPTVNETIQSQGLHGKASQRRESNAARRYAVDTFKQQLNQLSLTLKEDEEKFLSIQTQQQERIDTLLEQEAVSKKTINELITTIDLLSQKNVEYKNAISSYKEALAVKDKELQDCKADSKKTIATLGEKVDTLSQRLDAKHQTAFAKAQGTIALLRQQLDDVLQENEQLQKSHNIQDQQMRDINELQEQNKTKDKVIDELKIENAETFDKLRDSEAKLSLCQAERRERERKWAENRDVRQQLTTELTRDKETLRQLLDDERHKGKELQERLQHLKERDATSNGIIAKQQQQLADLLKKTDAERQKALSDQMELKETIEELLVNSEKEEKTNKELDQKLREKSHKLREYQSIISSYQDQIRNKLREQQELDVAIHLTTARLKGEVDRFSQRLEAEQQKTGIEEIQQQAMQDQIQNLEADLRKRTAHSLKSEGHGLPSQHMRSCQHTEASLQQLRQVTAALEAERRERARERETCDSQIASLTVQLEQARDKLGRWSAAREGLRDATTQARPPAGIPNLGNTCYINSVIQCLYSIASLRDYLISDTYRRDMNPNSEQRGEVVSSMADVVKALHYGSRKDINDKIRKFKVILGNHDPEFRGNSQCEAYDLLSSLLTWLHNDLAQVNESSFISDVFYGEQESLLTCHRHGVVNRSKEPFSSLILAVVANGQVPTLEELVRSHYKEEEIEWDCPYCGFTHMCSHGIKILQVPAVLVVHLSRYNSRDSGSSKTRVIFPSEEFSLKDHTVQKAPSPSYDLAAVCVHHGNTSSGHYTAFCRRQQQQQQQQQQDSWVWWLCNDNIVSKTDLCRVLSENDAHILFYSHRN